MKRLAFASLLLALATPACALSIASVQLQLDDDGEPGDVVDAFNADDRVQHFNIELDETKIGQHEWVVEFWAQSTDAGDEIKVSDFHTDGLIANTIDAMVSLPRDWPVGTYRLDVKMDGTSIGTHEYHVNEAGTGDSD